MSRFTPADKIRQPRFATPRRFWLLKYEIASGLLVAFAVFLFPWPHGLLFGLLALTKFIGLVTKFDKLVPNIVFDLALGIYGVLVGHPWIGLFAFLIGRFRDFEFTVLPGEERHKKYWTGNTFNRKDRLKR